MHEKNILSGGAAIVLRNKRYILWFFLLNLALASMGSVAFVQHARAVLDRSLYAGGLVHGFDLPVFIELLARPEFGPMQASTLPAFMFSLLFALLSLVFMPGVLLGYASDHRVPRAEFFRTCGQNLWRFVRLALFFAVFAGIVVGVLSAIQTGLLKAADASSYEKLPFWVQTAGTILIFLVATFFRIWFDLAEIDVVVTDQRAVRKSIASNWRRTRTNFGALFGSYVLIAIVGLLVLAIGLWFWNVVVPPPSVLGAFVVSQLILLLLLAVRFWQRATAAALYTKWEPTAVETQPLPATLSPAAAGPAGGI